MIGISITTHNRPEVLAYTLKHFMTFLPSTSFVLVVSDDASNPTNADRNCSICTEFGVDWIYSEERLGIAKNKNKSIEWLREQDVDCYFLFDDDCFPIHYGWEKPFIDLALTENIQHSMYLVPAGPDVAISETFENYNVWTNCGGFCLFFTKTAMDKLVGYNPEFTIYGYEHGEITYRANRLGLTAGKGTYISPKNADKFIYSIDMDLGWMHKPSPLGPMLHPFTSSVENERPLIAGWVEENARVYNRAIAECDRNHSKR